MNREQLSHLLRAASRIADEEQIVVIGSQSILGTFDETQLPPEAVFSMEADFAFWNDENNSKSDAVDGVMGEIHNSMPPMATTPKASASPQRCYPTAGSPGLSFSRERAPNLVAACASSPTMP